jgi:small redox-active disulfide protein 2
MNIKILGSGCAKCKRLEQLVRKVVIANQIEAQIEKVTDYTDIMRYPILSTPALVVDGEVAASGRIPSEDEILGWLKK